MFFTTWNIFNTEIRQVPGNDKFYDLSLHMFKLSRSKGTELNAIESVRACISLSKKILGISNFISKELLYEELEVCKTLNYNFLL